ncbi:hypothetical protein GCM10022408_05770 [Hymenobacter fastidiosus]|uniref:DUF4468 domain-containing protein n=1 Tax=Hymenobacter fastidiosus TaxID=486264 RepID=A0ABP7RI60_9BACT
MKTLLLCAVALGLAGKAHAQVTPAESQALAKQINQLMRNPQKPKQEVRLTLRGCHAEQLIRDRDADVETTRPLAVSFGSGNSGWAMKMDNGVFELKMDFEWADVTALTYQLSTDDDEPRHYEIKIAKRRKSSTTSFELPLYTTSEATVKDVVRRLEKVRQSCREGINN